MAINSYGFTGTMAQDKWAELARLMATSTEPHVVEGFDLTTPAGTRVVAWTTGRLVAAGVLAVNTAAGSTTFDANTSGFPRIDWLVAETEWGAVKTTVVKFIKGTAQANPQPPALIQTEGVKWQTPFARVTIPNLATQLGDGDVGVCHPRRTRVKFVKPTLIARDINAAAGSTLTATAVIDDPGWPHRVRVYGVQNFDQIAGQGHGELAATLDGAELTSGRAPDKNISPCILRPEISSTRTGPGTVTFRILPVGMSAPDHLTTRSNHSGYTVEIIPA